ncbi:MAG: MarR family transcriptional regulator [Phycisphaeraceae bacterium]|nr:MAG: MarR family transcriptional regulator [Phycisphaeraceae bacterium]
MGTRWGVNRTVAQVHALLFLSSRPLNAEEIAETLSVARSNVSTSLRELQGWRLIRPVQRMGDRREYYESLGDVWEMFRIVLEERKKREIDPTLVMLRECVADMGARPPAREAHAADRIRAMLDFFETMNKAHEATRSVSTQKLCRALKAGNFVRRLFGAAS